MKKKYGVMGIIALVILVVMTCGCTSSDASTIKPQEDRHVRDVPIRGAYSGLWCRRYLRVPVQ